MSEWPGEASDEVQEDFDRLAEVTIAAAQHFLDLNGDFIPFPMAVKADGELALIGLEQPQPPTPPDPNEVIDGIVALFRERSGSVRALAIGADIEIAAEAMDAIEVRLEHRDGFAITVIVPYQMDPLDDSYLYDEPRVTPATPRIWN